MGGDSIAFVNGGKIGDERGDEQRKTVREIREARECPGRREESEESGGQCGRDKASDDFL